MLSIKLTNTDFQKTAKYSYVGQNMAKTWGMRHCKKGGHESDIQSWYDEVKDFPARNVRSFSEVGATGMIGHYTQEIRALISIILVDRWLYI